jgi:hypothetical protein
MLFNVVEAGNLPKGGIITDDLMNVQGRFVASDGTWVDGAAAAAKADEESRFVNNGINSGAAH